jgi:hypothetical protein
MILAVENETVRVDGRVYRKSTETSVGFGQTDIVTHYGRRALDGVYEIHPDFKSPQEYLIMPLPLVAGARWSVESPLGDALSCTAVEAGEVDVLGRMYKDCLNMVCEGPRALGGEVFEARLTETRSPGIGMVRATTETPGFTVELRLKVMKRGAAAS